MSCKYYILFVKNEEKKIEGKTWEMNEMREDVKRKEENVSVENDGKEK